MSVKDYYAELPIAVRVTGRYHDMGAFAADVANLSRIVTLNNLSVTPQKDGALTMDATARTFRYLDEEEQAAQKRAARGGEEEMRTLGFLWLGVAVVGLSGCMGSEQEDLQRWMAEQRAQVRPDGAAHHGAEEVHAAGLHRRRVPSSPSTCRS